MRCSFQAANIFLVSAALKGQNITDVEHLSTDARTLAMSARQSAKDYLEIWLDSAPFLVTLRYATHSTFVEVSFCVLLLLKLSRLFPDGVDSLEHVTQQCYQLQQHLQGIPRAERFARTIKCALLFLFEDSRLTDVQSP